MIDARLAPHRPHWWQWRARRRYDETCRVFHQCSARPGGRMWQEIQRQP